MRQQWTGAALVAALAVFCTAGSGSAQQRQQSPAQPSIMQEEDQAPPANPPQQPGKPARRSQTPAPAFEQDPDLDAADQLAPSQVTQPMPGAVAEPNRPGSATRTAPRVAAHASDAMAEAAPTAKPARQAAPKAVACNGVFGKDSNRVKLAAVFQAKNIADTEVDTASGNKVMASVLFANDPKRRLEVWWTNQEKRSDIHLIVINGDSDWAAPGGLHLGLTLAELEKLNHRAFKLSGFDKSHVATLIDWNGGELAYLSGGCKIGVSLRASPNASAIMLALFSADHEFTSADAGMRAANPTVSEILVAY